MSAPNDIAGLADRFARNRQACKAAPYNETQLRREFIDPFFIALGWDVNNASGYAEAYKDVIHEDAIRIGDAMKAPDYCFRIGGARKFFVEAKKPSIDIHRDPHSASTIRCRNPIMFAILPPHPPPSASRIRLTDAAVLGTVEA
jgi:hypothetical protein